MGEIVTDKSNVYSHGKRTEYPDGSYKLICCSRPVFRVPGWEDHYADQRRERNRLIDEHSIHNARTNRDLAELGWEARAKRAPSPENIQRAARRASARVRDLALCNDFAWFVTLTLDAQKIDRYDVSAITKKLRTWLDNKVRRQGLKYILVPERHKDGALHFHGFINEAPGLVPSGTWDVPGHKKPIRPRSSRQAAEWAALGPGMGYHEVFNWEAWPLGFSTAIRLYGEYRAAVGYVCKYIAKQTKDADGKIGGRWYYSGGELREPTITYPDYAAQDLLQWTPDAYTFDIPEARLTFAMYSEAAGK